MKATAFRQLIRDEVRDAVRDVIREELSEIKNAINENRIQQKPLVENRGEKIIFGNKAPLMGKPFPKPINALPKPTQKTGNVLFDLINETKLDSDEYRTMIGATSMDAQSFNSSNLVNEMSGNHVDVNNFSTGNSVQEMIESAKIKGPITSLETGADNIGPIEAVPDFTQFMSVLKSKGKI